MTRAPLSFFPSKSVPPSPASQRLDRWGRWLLRIGQALGILVLFRLSYTAWDRIDHSKDTASLGLGIPTASASPELSALPSPSALASTLASSALSSEPPQVNAPNPSASNAPELRTVLLFVEQKSTRSEVFVEGSSVGHTPYVGHVQCMTGRVFHVNLLPPKGMPVSFEPHCIGNELHLRAP